MIDIQDDQAKYFRDSPGTLVGHNDTSPVDVRSIIDNAKWPRIFRACWKKSGGQGRWNAEWFGIIPEAEYIRSVSLGLPLTPEDWYALIRKCRNGYARCSTRDIPKLEGNLLFLIDELEGLCTGIFRFAIVDEQYRVVEHYIYGADDNDLSLYTRHNVELLSHLLPGRRFRLLNPDYDDLSWHWRDPDDPGYQKPKPQPWSAVNPEWMLKNARLEPVDLSLQFEGDNEAGPLKLNGKAMWILRKDPNLCHKDSINIYLFSHEQGTLLIYGNGGMRYIVFFEEVDGGYICRKALVNRDNSDVQCCCPDADAISADIWEAIGELLCRKDAWYEQQRRWHKALMLPPVYLE